MRLNTRFWTWRSPRIVQEDTRPCWCIHAILRRALVECYPEIICLSWPRTELCPLLVSKYLFKQPGAMEFTQSGIIPQSPLSNTAVVDDHNPEGSHDYSPITVTFLFQIFNYQFIQLLYSCMLQISIQLKIGVHAWRLCSSHSACRFLGCLAYNILLI